MRKNIKFLIKIIFIKVLKDYNTLFAIFETGRYLF